jgi:hypothetical protein
MKYRFGGKEERIAFGVFPEVSRAKSRARRCGAVATSRPRALGRTAPGQAQCRHHLRGRRPGTVATLTESQVCLLAQALESESRDTRDGKRTHCPARRHFADYWLSPEGEELSSLMPLNWLAGSALRIPYHRRVVAINLMAPDDVILSDLQACFDETRKATRLVAAPHAFTTRDFERWCKLAFVPYLILSLWHRTTRHMITQNEMAELLFPDDARKSGDNIRRTTGPGAEQWLCASTGFTLEAQAARLVGENRHD